MKVSYHSVPAFTVHRVKIILMCTLINMQNLVFLVCAYRSQNYGGAAALPTLDAVRLTARKNATAPSVTTPNSASLGRSVCVQAGDPKNLGTLRPWDGGMADTKFCRF